MVNQTLELRINSASDLKNVNHITKMDVYAVITLLGDKKKQKAKTPINRSGGSNPTWNHAATFPVKEELAREGRLTLVVNLFSHRRIRRDKAIGKVEVPLLNLLSSTNGNGMKFVTYQVRTPSDQMKGSLTFSYRFNGAPVIAGQAHYQAPTSWAPPNQQGYGGPNGYMAPPTPQLTRNQERLDIVDTFASVVDLLK
ncbi:unnamed protein product [Microthlaspi erraticum]|uniref:C2 domain-containing protein n=1 Tax=Microthlaspi erraticum TaxID=1685480 RepID=A0A6D2KYJ6_9BRAS|nr:unnamed protein product [Microthlaspi erraticum]